MLQVVQKCSDDFTAERNRLKKARLSQDLLALLMYTALTPGRCKEYTTLKFEVHEDCLPPLEATPGAPNSVHITACGDAAHMVLADHKTSNRHGCDHVLLSGDGPLLRHLAQHLQHHQHLLASTEDCQWLFVVSTHVHRYVGHGVMHTILLRTAEGAHLRAAVGQITLRGSFSDIQARPLCPPY